MSKKQRDVKDTKKEAKKKQKNRQRAMTTALTATKFMMETAHQWFTQIGGYKPADIVTMQESDSDPASPLLWVAWIEIGGLKRFSVTAFNNDGQLTLVHTWLQPQEMEKTVN